MYPVVSETYIGEDIDALRESGAEVSVTALAQAVSAKKHRSMPSLDVDSAIEET